MSTSQTFYKLTGSGNDFVFIDSRNLPEPHPLENPEAIARLCARGTGVGADGVVFLANGGEADIGIRYYNADGSRALLCGNATLCTARLAVFLGAADATGFTIATDAGVSQANLRNALPEFELPIVSHVESDISKIIGQKPGERRIGFAITGVPHVVILLDDVNSVDVKGRGAPIRYNETFPEGANVNFVARSGDDWVIRTYERGVEDETLACGTGNVAAAVMLASWGEASVDEPVRLWTRSGQALEVVLRRTDWRNTVAWLPLLRGEGRVVYRGELGID